MADEESQPTGYCPICHADLKYRIMNLVIKGNGMSDENFMKKVDHEHAQRIFRNTGGVTNLDESRYVVCTNCSYCERIKRATEAEVVI